MLDFGCGMTPKQLSTIMILFLHWCYTLNNSQRGTVKVPLSNKLSETVKNREATLKTMRHTHFTLATLMRWTTRLWFVERRRNIIVIDWFHSLHTHVRVSVRYRLAPIPDWQVNDARSQKLSDRTRRAKFCRSLQDRASCRIRKFRMSRMTFHQSSLAHQSRLGLRLPFSVAMIGRCQLPQMSIFPKD